LSNVVTENDGAVVVGGYVPGTGVVVNRYTATGAPDTSFGGDGSVVALSSDTYEFPRIVKRTSGGYLIISLNLGTPPYRVAALTNSGALDTSWAPSASVPGVLPFDGYFHGEPAMDGDKLVAIGSFLDASLPEIYLMRFTASGALDPSFGGGDGLIPIPSHAPDGGVTVHAGSYYVTSAYWQQEEPYDSAMTVAKFSSTGVLDTSFGTSGVAYGFLDEDIASEGRLFFAGGYLYLVGTRCCGETPLEINRFSANGLLDTSYGDGGRLLLDTINGSEASGVAVGVQPNGQLLLAFNQLEVLNEMDYVYHTGVVRLFHEVPLPEGVPGAMVPLAPARILDTRTGLGAPVGKIAAGASLDLAVAGRGGVPSQGVSAVVLNVTVTEPGAPGYLTVYPSDVDASLASNLNFNAGQTIPNLVTVKLGADGHVKIKNGSWLGAHVIADVAGYYLAGTPTDPGTFVALPPSRVLDTRTGTGAPTGKLGAGAALNLTIAGQAGVPASGAGAVIVNVTVTEPGAPGYVTVYPSNVSAPNASNLNFVAGQTIPNLVVVKLGPDGHVKLTNGSWLGTHLIGDVAGYFLA